MKYSRKRNSSYASYARRAGNTARFSIPTRRVANFNPMLDMLNQAATYGGDLISGGLGDAAMQGRELLYNIPDMAQSIGGDALNAGRDFLNQAGGTLGDLGQNISQGIGQAGNAIGDLGQNVAQGFGRAADTFSNLPNAAKAATGATGAAALGGLGAMANSARKGMQAAPAAQPGKLAQGLRKAKDLLKNPYAVAGGVGAAGLGGIAGANALMNRDDEEMM